MTACDPVVAVKPHPRQHVTAKCFSQRHPFASAACWFDPNLDVAARQSIQNLLNQREALLNLTDANPDSRVDVPCLEHRHLERQLVIRCVARQAACIEGPTRRAPDITASAELARVLALHDA